VIESRLFSYSLGAPGMSGALIGILAPDKLTGEKDPQPMTLKA
jgi:hypothetical protein